MPFLLSISHLRRFAGLAGALALIAWDIHQRPAAPSPPKAVAPAGPALSTAYAPSLQRTGSGTLPMPRGMPAAHASSLLAMPAGHPAALTAFWFAGTRESAADVQILASQFDRASQRWSAAHVVVNRHALGQNLGFGVRRLGNPVAWLDASGRMHLWVVATGNGGWAASRIAHLRQVTRNTEAASGDQPAALRFEAQGTVPLSWLWNTSHLVRNAPLSLQDGGMMLPVHFELGIKYPLALRFDRRGEFLGMARLSRRTHVLQPSLLPLGEQHWLALMRDQRAQGRITAVATHDGGKHWQDLPDLPLANPDAAVTALSLGPGQLVLAHNSSPHSRSALALSASGDGLVWQDLQVLAQGSAGEEFSYPALAWVDGSLWVSYTEQRRHIAWQRFSVASSPARSEPKQ